MILEDILQAAIMYVFRVDVLKFMHDDFRG